MNENLLSFSLMGLNIEMDNEHAWDEQTDKDIYEKYLVRWVFLLIFVVKQLFCRQMYVCKQS